MSAENAKIILGTRGSELARAQTRLVEEAIRSASPHRTIETKVIATHGDKGRTLDPAAGRKGLFTAEIERALVAGEVDVAVHSAKDLPSETTPGVEITSVLPRAPVQDALISKHFGGLASLPGGATLATGSVRRKHQLLWKRPDLKLIDLRGNVPTRLRKLAENNWDAIVLARAGLHRLGMSLNAKINFDDRIFFMDVLPVETFLPAGGQGIIALEIRAGDERTRAVVDLVNDPGTLLCLQAERQFLGALHGDCNCPVGVLAKIQDGRMRMRAQLFRGETTVPRKAEVAGACNEGDKLAAELLRRIEEE